MTNLILIAWSWLIWLLIVVALWRTIVDRLDKILAKLPDPPQEQQRPEGKPELWR